MRRLGVRDNMRILDRRACRILGLRRSNRLSRNVPRAKARVRLLVLRLRRALLLGQIGQEVSCRGYLDGHGSGMIKEDMSLGSFLISTHKDMKQ